MSNSFKRKNVFEESDDEVQPVKSVRVRKIKAVKEEEKREDTNHEDDYLSMPIENYQPIEDTEKDEALMKATGQSIQDYTLSKALKTSIIDREPENRGLKIMKLMGFKPSESESDKSRSESPSVNEPIIIERKIGRGGIGYDSAIRDEITKAVDDHIEKQKLSKEDFLGRIQKDYSEKKLESQVKAAQKIAIELDARERNIDSDEIYNTNSSVNILYRGFIHEYQLAKKIRELRRNFDTPGFDDTLEEFEQDSTDQQELQEFQSLQKSDQLFQLIEYLRNKYYYCIFCGCSYDDEQDLQQNCPGMLETDH